MPLYRKWYPDSNFCKACEKEKDINDMGYCRECNEELEYYFSKPAWHHSTVVFGDGNIVLEGKEIKLRGIVHHQRGKDFFGDSSSLLSITYCNQVKGEINRGFPNKNYTDFTGPSLDHEVTNV